MGIVRRLLRPRLLRTALIPDDDWSELLRQHPILAGLADEEARRLRELSTLFLHEKTYSAAEGFELTEHLRAVIAVQACLPVLGLDIDWYENWRTVVVVPEGYRERFAESDETGVVGEWEDDVSGVSAPDGPVVVSWDDVEASGWGDGYNVVIHEAAHRLDLTDGADNGRPALHRGMDPEEWRRVFSGSFVDLSRRVRSRKRRSKIDGYATESDSEFFAVASEYFFEKPRILTAEYPEVYRLLSSFYRQDTAARLAGARGTQRRPGR